MIATHPVIRLRVGVSGHRLPPKLPKQSEAPLHGLVDRILATMADAARRAEKSAHAPDPSERTAAQLVIVSSLAEGADRIVAEAGLAAGFALEVVLPFSRTEYARDFETPASQAAFQQLLDRASAVIELDGSPDERPRAYEAAGLCMLSEIDVLIAIWDGERAAGAGGTAEIVDRAVAERIFVVWIEPAHPDSFKVSPWDGGVRRATATARPNDSFRFADVAVLSRAVERIVALPTQ